MKLKQRPDDFRVEELTAEQPQERGSFAYYRLEKQGIGTPEALQHIARRWRIKPEHISHGGLKDRHAVTSQFLTIWHGPRRGLKQSGLALHYLGQRSEAYSSRQVLGNRFQLTLRNFEPDQADFACHALEQVRKDGVPNYFDDQRFGSVTQDREFIARKLIDGDYESALRLALAEPYGFDDTHQKMEKRILREHWGRWREAEAKLPKGHMRSIVAHLGDHATDFRGAVAMLRADLKSLYLSAYQSWLWNRLLARWLGRECRPEQLIRIRLKLEDVPMPIELDHSQRAPFHAQRLPLLSARLKVAEHDPLRPLIDDVLRDEGLELNQLKLKHFREPFFSKGERRAFFVPEELTYVTEADEVHSGKRKLRVSFDLPRGCYATMLIKRITHGTESLPSLD